MLGPKAKLKNGDLSQLIRACCIRFRGRHVEIRLSTRCTVRVPPFALIYYHLPCTFEATFSHTISYLSATPFVTFAIDFELKMPSFFVKLACTLIALSVVESRVKQPPPPTKAYSSKLKGVRGYKEKVGDDNTKVSYGGRGCVFTYVERIKTYNCNACMLDALQVCTVVEAPPPKHSSKPKLPTDGLPKTVRHEAHPSKAEWSEGDHHVAHLPKTYIWRQHGYLCPTELSFFKHGLEPIKLTPNLQQVAANSSVWSGDGAHVGAAMLSAIQHVMHDGHTHPLHEPPCGEEVELTPCTCQCIFTKPPMKTTQRVNQATTSDLCMEWDTSKVAAQPHLFRVSKGGYLQLKVGSTNAGARKQAKYEFAHRVVLNMLEGLVDGHNVVCHTCDNTRCLNPRHMLWGTSRINRRARDLNGDALDAHYSQLIEERKRRWAARQKKWKSVRAGLSGVCKRSRPSSRARGV